MASGYLWNSVTAAPAAGETSVVFTLDPPLLLNGDPAVFVFRNGVKALKSALTITSDSVTVSLGAGQETTGDDSWECDYPTATIDLTGALTAADVMSFVSLPVFEVTEAQATRALSAALGWARAHVAEDALTDDELAKWQTAVLLYSWSILTRGSQPVLSVEAGGTTTSWGAVGGLNPSEEFRGSAEDLLAQVGTWNAPRSWPPATDRLTEALAAATSDIPISLRTW